MERSDTGFATVNLALLSVVALLPWPTELLGDYGEEPLAVVVYAVNIVALAVMLNVMHWMADRRGLVHYRTLDPAARLRGPLVIGVFSLSIPLAFVDPTLARWCWTLVIVLPPLVAWYSRRRAD